MADFLEIEIDSAKFDEIVAHCGLEHMRSKADKEAAFLKDVFKNGATSFFFKGTNGRWKDVLTAEDNARYAAEVAKHLTPEAAVWLETGKV